MTTADQSPVRRVVRVRGIEYVARITPEGVYIREKRKRTEYGPISWGLILLRGGEMRAREILAERQAKRKDGRLHVKRGTL